MEVVACNYRLFKQHGRCCLKSKTTGPCRHAARGQCVSKTINAILDGGAAWDWDHAPEYFARAYEHGIGDAEITRALRYIFGRAELMGHAWDLGARCGKRALDAACLHICHHYARIAFVVRTPRLLRAIRRIQALWRQYMHRSESLLHGPWSGPDAAGAAASEAPVNSTDPITLEPVADIAPKLRFSYRAPDGRLYVFSAPELYQYMKAFDTINPYTREPMPQEALSRLVTLVERMPAAVRQPMIVWRTPRDAFVEVLYYYSCQGFYASVEWFLALPIANIYDLYERMSRDPGVPHRFFRVSSLDDSIVDFYADGPHFALAQTMRDIIQTTFPTQFYTICRLFVLLAEVTPEMLETIPAWMRSAA